MTADVLNPVSNVNVNVTLRVLNSLSPKSVRMIFQRLKVELPSVGQTEASVQKTLFLEKRKGVICLEKSFTW